MTAESYVLARRRRPRSKLDLAAMDEDERSGGFRWGLVKRFGPYVAPYKWRVIASACLMVVYTLSSLASPYLIGRAIDAIRQTHDLGSLTVISLLLLAANVIAWQAQFWQTWTMSWAGQQALYRLSSDMYRHIQALSLSFYDRTEIGRVMSRLQSDITVLEGVLSNGLLSMLASVISLGGIIFVMLGMNPGLALLTFSVLPFMFAIAWFWQRHAQRSFRRTRAAISLVNSTLQENISGMRVIQALAREDRNSAEFDDLNRHNRDTNLESTKIASLILPLVEVVAAVAIALVVVVGGLQVAHHELAIGTLVAFTLYINQFFNPIRNLSMQYSQLQRAGVAAERIFQILGIPVEIQDAPDARDLPQIEGRVEFRDVTFGYDPEKPVLRGFNLKIEPGQTVAIVGPTGAGKSTIVSLVSRFYDVQGGSVLVDGRDVREVTQRSLRSQVGVVLQDPFLFTGTISDNIRYGKLDATQEEIEEAAKAVGAHDLILRLPDGYDTQIRERGQNLSNGQRQLISFARALLSDPRILILDEATANIDTVTEAIVQQGLQRLLSGRTAIVIAHRLSTIKNAVVIVVLQDGRIVEKGAHVELLAKGGEYAQLYAMGFRHTQSEVA